jgi:Domain of unknown function (DUF4145)
MTERDHFSEGFRGRIPAWRCPKCWNGTLAVTKDTEKAESTAESLAARDHDAWEPDWDVERFVMLMHCQNSDCGEVVCVSGERTFELFKTDWDEYEQLFTYTPKAVVPGIPVFKIPEKCPHEVAEQVLRAFDLLWSDLGACANRLRIAIERLLDDRKINKTNGRSRRARDKLSTHARIDLLAARYPEASDHLMAIKWLGNEGSHQGAVDREDILDAFELMHAVIDEIYIGTAAKLKKKAKSLKARKGKPRKVRG